MDIGRRMKKKSVEHMIFSTMALMNTITNDRYTENVTRHKTTEPNSRNLIT